MFDNKAVFPVAVFQSPVVFDNKALFPVAVFAFPVVFDNKALFPVAVFQSPVVFEYNALFPKAVLEKIESPLPLPTVTSLISMSEFVVTVSPLFIKLEVAIHSVPL